MHLSESEIQFLNMLPIQTTEASFIHDILRVFFRYFEDEICKPLRAKIAKRARQMLGL